MSMNRLTSFALLFLLLAASTPEAQPSVVGDVTDDTRVSTADVVGLVDHLTEASPLAASPASAADLDGDALIGQRDLDLLVDTVLARLPEQSFVLSTTAFDSSPRRGEDDVALTRETVLSFSLPLGLQPLGNHQARLESGGVEIPTTYHLGADATTLTLRQLDDLPAASRVTVTVEGDALLDVFGRPVDADDDGQPGGRQVFSFDTIGSTPLPGTSVCGRVFASALSMGPDGEARDRPLPGVRVTIDGRPDGPVAVTDACGNFRLEPAPAGRFFVHVDGRTATVERPEGSYYPTVGKPFVSVAGRDVVLPDIFLPLVAADTLREVSVTSDTEVTFPSSVLSESPELAGVTITVPGGALIDESGTSVAGRVGIAPVPPDRLPGPLPPELRFPLVITIQVEGGTDFDVPTPACFPNQPDPVTGVTLGPGERTALWSFDHDRGRWVMQGPATIDPTGRLACTDPGVGIRAPGWHGVTPATSGQDGSAHCEEEDPADPDAGIDELSCDLGDGSDPGSDPDDGGTDPDTGGGDDMDGDGDMDGDDDGEDDEDDPLPGDDDIEPGSEEDCADFKPGDPIHFFSGEFYLNEEDIRVPGIGLDFVWSRSYRSRVWGYTNLGWNWDHGYNLFVLRPGDGSRIVSFGTGRRVRFERQGIDLVWRADEEFMELVRLGDDSYELTHRDGRSWAFQPLRLEGEQFVGKIAEIRDRQGNRISLAYDVLGRLETITDTLGRTFTVEHDLRGRIRRVSGAGVFVSYEHDSADDLVGVTRPDRGTVRYTYSSRTGDQATDHNLLTMTDWEGRVIVENVYSPDRDPRGRNFDRILRQHWGGTLAVQDPGAPSPGNVKSGGVLDFTYLTEQVSRDRWVVRSCLVNDRVGAVTHYFFDEHNRITRERRYYGHASPAQPTTLTRNLPITPPGKPEFVDTIKTLDADGLVTRVEHPNGRVTELVYEKTMGSDGPRISEGNLRARREIHDGVVHEERFEYEPGRGDCCGRAFLTLEVDQEGRETHHVLDEWGNRLQTTHSRPGEVENFEHDAYGRLTAHVHAPDPDGRRRRDEYAYEGTPFLKKVTIDVGGLELVTTYDHDVRGNITHEVDPRGNLRRAHYNLANDLVEESWHDGPSDAGLVLARRELTYDRNGRLIEEKLVQLDDDLVPPGHEDDMDGGLMSGSRGWRTVHVRGLLGEVVRRRTVNEGGEDVLTDFEYDEELRLVRLRSGEAVVGAQPDAEVVHELDVFGQVIRQVHAPGSENELLVEYERDLHGNVTEERRGLIASSAGGPDRPPVQVYKTTWDGFDRAVTFEDPHGTLTTLTLDRVGNETGVLVEDRFGRRLRELRRVHDERNEVERVDVAHFDSSGLNVGDGWSTQLYERSPNGLIERAIDDLGRLTRYEFDTAHREVRVLDAGGNVVERFLDANGNVERQEATELSEVDASTRTYVVENGLDALNRVVRTEDSAGIVTTRSFDGRGLPIRSIDGRGNVTWSIHDGAGRLIETIRELRSGGTGDGALLDVITTRQEWDRNGRLVAQVDDEGQATRYVHDARDRVVRIEHPDGTAEERRFDRFSRVSWMRDANGSVSESIYDDLNRLLRRDHYPAPGVSTELRFEEYDHDPLSRIIRAADDDSEVLFEHDSLDQVTSETLTGFGSTTSAWDGAGNLKRRCLPGGRCYDFDQDDLDRLDRIREDGETLLEQWHAGGRLVRRELGNGTVTTHAHDVIARPERTTHTSAGGTALEDWSYLWDDNHNKTRRRNERTGLWQHDYKYDSADRMIESITMRPSLPELRISYDLDGAGNRERVLGGEGEGLYSRDPRLGEAHGPVNAYSSTPFGDVTHDWKGNLVVKADSEVDRQTMQYDVRSQLVRVENELDGTVVRYDHDALGRRIRRSVQRVGEAAEITTYLCAGSHVVEEHQSGTVISYVRAGLDDLVLRQAGSLRSWYHADDMGNVISLTDDAGEVVERVTYEDYGLPTFLDGDDLPMPESLVGNEYLFTGRRWEGTTGFYHFRARELDPETGRFLTRDPLGTWGDVGNLGNGYAYVGNNPWSRVDPDGLEAESSLSYELQLVWDRIGAPMAARLQESWDNNDGALKLAFARGFAEGGWEELKTLYHVASSPEQFGLELWEGLKELHGMALAGDQRGVIRTVAPTLYAYLFCSQHLSRRDHAYYAGDAARQLVLGILTGGAGTGTRAALDVVKRSSKIRKLLQKLPDPNGLLSRQAAPDGCTNCNLPGECFAGDTLVCTPDGLVAISEIQIGDHVLVAQPASEEQQPFEHASSCLLLELEATSPEGRAVHIEVVRSREWCELVGARPGAWLYLESEAIADGLARVTGVTETHCPVAATDSASALITGIIVTESRPVLEVIFDGEGSPLLATAEHPLWSENHETWITAGQLAPGDQLHSPNGSVQVTQIWENNTPIRVFNLEVAVHHEYQVTESCLRVHNSYQRRQGSLRWLGNGRWESPGGLIYGQGSAHGNRVKHVLAHTKPDPSKPMHSVFTADRTRVLAVVDEAWTRRGAALPNDPAAFVVPMGRVVGTNGERAVKLIVRPGTTEIITAYPVH
ncbi:MAG: RHS repeat-associated core domain-containing protein [Acidobacteriota bacterium]